jgi:hypothetical protein
VLRLAAIYGPGRGVRERLRAGNYRLLDDGAHYFSRVHVDDLVGVIRAAAARAPAGAVYCVGDDRPTTQREYADWLAARLGTPAPPSVATLEPGRPRRAVRNRQIANTKLKRELCYTFRYPSYIEGEQAIEAESGLRPVEVAPAALPQPPAGQAPAPKEQVAPEPTPSARAVAEVEARWWRAFDEELALGGAAALERAEALLVLLGEQRRRLEISTAEDDLVRARARLSAARGPG